MMSVDRLDVGQLREADVDAYHHCLSAQAPPVEHIFNRDKSYKNCSTKRQGKTNGKNLFRRPQAKLCKKQVKTNGTIDFINGSKNFLCESIYNHIPKVGDIIFFPNYLMHTAYPFHVEGERRSFSLNIQLDQKITKIFHG